MCPCSACTAASASSDSMRSCSVSPIPTRIPLVNGIRSSPAARIVSRRRAGMLGRRARMHRLHQALGDRLEHQPLRGGHLAQPREILAREHAEVRVRQQAPLERALAHPHDVGGEVRVPVLAQALGDLGVDLGALAGQDQQLLDLPARRPRRGSRAPARARTGGPCGSRTRSTCSSSGRCATATASGCARR